MKIRSVKFVHVCYLLIVQCSFNIVSFPICLLSCKIQPQCDLNIMINILLMCGIFYQLPRSMYCLAVYYVTDVMLYCAWSSFLDLRQAHYRYNNLNQNYY